MFQHDLSEGKSSVVKIEDIPHDVFKEMLSFLYTGNVANLDQMAAELLRGADKVRWPMLTSFSFLTNTTDVM